MTIKKAIIPAAGLGTRFLPATKAQPKEMLPIVDKPTIQYIVEEAIASGIEDILIISGRGKRAIEDHFDKSFELEETLEQKGKLEDLKQIQAISNLANIHYVRQKEPKGLGHAILCAKSFIGQEPFAVLLGDDIVQAETPCTAQLIEVYEKYKSTVVGVQWVADKDVNKYGIVDAGKEIVDRHVIPVRSLVEKPQPSEAPSNYAIMGRYILTPEIFNILETQQPGAGGEIQLTDAIRRLNENRPTFAYEFEGIRYDVGDKLGFIKATIDFALQRPDLSSDLYRYIREIYEKDLILQGG
ncbi:UTP--glucose-1-phosphate uridylyltransferase [Paenibacillus chitinolyticus]|uniref:UTP--glucose-1-phosphate uridylyltransferase n=1 Tax=Paenibacillus chitinolyticus TaxID=79263 RepID=A0A410WS60_9BACL|nr:UTP--glucose-1-phosphate uridylyltransferase GalU [Paenibacillus chitinolyticus]MCY9588931.1 UTP--glucose-1-phosphate uridylyltransferase GalU [Paenibacillus chitinolyticus]MCY9595385.1 UTP--glucose-1-phosphate uridylyltransferase GalU [Paenibacillus chitinolyticus]QAV17161.1 UTP--glucose-1-phosphate uridylyltransferase [Paenibacillus chitinolyticus]